MGPLLNTLVKFYWICQQGLNALKELQLTQINTQADLCCWAISCLYPDLFHQYKTPFLKHVLNRGLSCYEVSMKKKRAVHKNLKSPLDLSAQQSSVHTVKDTQG